ncbi:hypothetical protein PR048_000132 [Dryococelus australis]|uniref:Uncharacterized protein n=1 Tax=Dryococelus australis TaxID=614101 RepID=A0ABQ9IDT2_9NEOP|nr:hypothetical protein PR048_000132 [Dryococelus australis]
MKELGSLSTTRWNCRYKNCRRIIAIFLAGVQALSEEIEEGKDKGAGTGMGILSSIKIPNCTDYLVESSVGQTVTAVDGETLDKEYWCCHVYYAVFDSIMVSRFYNRGFPESVDCFQSLDMEESEIFSNAYKNELGMNYRALKSEVSVFKNFLKTKKSESEWDHRFIRNDVDKSYKLNLHKGLQLSITILP